MFTAARIKESRTHASSTKGTASPFFQPKLTVNTPGDAHEQEADRVADQVMRMREGDAPIVQRMPLTPVSVQRKCAECEQEAQRKEDEQPEEREAPVQRMASSGGAAAPTDEEEQVQRKCTNCEKEEKEQVQRKETGGGDAGGHAAPSIVSDVLSSGGGQPMEGGTRQFMESRFGQDFSQVRIHTDSRAAESASAIQARAYTSGSNIVFGKGEYQPSTSDGQRLLAHELVHVGQQNKGSYLLQRWPGDGMLPPGDCSWATYTLLRSAVESAKAVVSMLGACSATDNCLTLATKIAAITAEIAARVALDTTCFRGGDSGHRQQVQSKVNMINRCYRFFQDSKCPQKLVEAMSAVVERAREIISGVATVALIVALIVAIIALLVIIAAAAPEIAAVALVIGVLTLIINEVSPANTSSKA